MAAFKVVPSGIIYGRMGRTMRNYGLRIITRPENKPPFTSRKKISLRIFRSRMMSMSIFVKISVMNAEESPEISYKINGMTIDELVRYLIQWTIYDIYQAGPSQRSSNRLRAKTSKGSPKPRALSLYLACM